MNKSTIGLDSSGNSNGVLLIFSLSVIFQLGCSDVSIAGGFPSSLFTDSSEDSFQRFFLLFVWLRWGIWNGISSSFLFLFLNERFGSLVVLIICWWIVNETSVSLNSSGNSNSVLLIFGLSVIFQLGCSDICITGGFPSSLFSNSTKNCFQRFLLLLIGLGWSIWNFSSFFLLLSLSLGKTVESVLLNCWSVVNESSGFLNPSGNSNSVFLIFRLLIIFLLSSRSVSITGSFPVSLDRNSFHDFS